jgi:hypothetical protein
MRHQPRSSCVMYGLGYTPASLSSTILLGLLGIGIDRTCLGKVTREMLQKVQLEFADIIEDEMIAEGSGELTSVEAAVPSARPAWSASQWSAFYGRSRLDEIAKENIWERVRSASTRSTWDDVRKGGAVRFDGGALQGIPYRGH